MSRRLIALLSLLTLAACGNPDPNAPLEPLGDFRLGHNIVLANEARKGPFSRDATRAELETALADAIEARIGRYDGDGLYHLGIAIGGYVLAQPGLPLIYTPKSVLVFDVTLYDNETREKLNEERHRITVFEGLRNTVPIIGSGHARTKEEQLQNLARQGALAVYNWLQQHPEWFTPDPGDARTPFDREAQDARRDELVRQVGSGAN